MLSFCSKIILRILFSFMGINNYGALDLLQDISEHPHRLWEALINNIYISNIFENKPEFPLLYD